MTTSFRTAISGFTVLYRRSWRKPRLTKRRKGGGRRSNEERKTKRRTGERKTRNRDRRNDGGGRSTVKDEMVGDRVIEIEMGMIRNDTSETLETERGILDTESHIAADFSFSCLLDTSPLLACHSSPEFFSAVCGDMAHAVLDCGSNSNSAPIQNPHLDETKRVLPTPPL